MATSIHQQLKSEYAERFDGEAEAVLDAYRVDVRCRDRVIEIQHASLSSIRDKTRALLKKHKVVIVKPLIFRKKLIKMASREGPEISRRYSPKRGSWCEAFHELIYFRELFPHKRLEIELLAVEIEEQRCPKKKHRFRRPDYRVIDQVMTRQVDSRRLKSGKDVLALLPAPLPDEFDTLELADLWSQPRWLCQRIAYFLRETGLIEIVGKRGRSMLYRPAA